MTFKEYFDIKWKEKDPKTGKPFKTINIYKIAEEYAELKVKEALKSISKKSETTTN